MIYEFNNDAWYEQATLNKETIGNTGPLFDIADVAFAAAEEQTYIYLADRLNGTHIINITNVNETT